MNKKSHDLNAKVPMRVRVPRAIRLRYLRLAAETPERERDESYFARIALELYADQEEKKLGLHPLTQEEIQQYIAELERRSRKPDKKVAGDTVPDKAEERSATNNAPPPRVSVIIKRKRR